MFALTTTRRLCARWVLAWYVLFVGVSVLAATLQPKTMDVVCSAMGTMKVVVQGEGENTAMSSSICGRPLLGEAAVSRCLQQEPTRCHRTAEL